MSRINKEKEGKGELDMEQYKEHEEYNKFMLELMKKANEINNDFNELSPVNQQRVMNEIGAMLMAGGASNVIQYIISYNQK